MKDTKQEAHVIMIIYSRLYMTVGFYCNVVEKCDLLFQASHTLVIKCTFWTSINKN